MVVKPRVFQESTISEKVENPFIIKKWVWGEILSNLKETLEKSDIILQIVDLRDPLNTRLNLIDEIFTSYGEESENNPNKKILIVLINSRIFI